ncbi:MAG: integrase [Burkholderiaceae bacterium]|nr:integrase [Burkholderiaceae bacterium]
MATTINTVSARDKLKIRREPYWHRVAKGCYLGYRKMTSGPGGTWIARLLDESTGKQSYNALGDFPELPDHMRFDAAYKAADAWFKHRNEGGSAIIITVGEACQRYVDKQRNEGKEAGAKDLEMRFGRWMYPDKKLSDTPITKLTQGQVNDWRMRLTKAPALLQDKTKAGTRQKSDSSINREMAVLKAALNLAVRDGYATSDAAWKYKLTPIKNATGRRDCYLDITQRRALIASAPADLAAYLKALSLLPFRPGAMAALTAGSFDKRLSVLTVGKDKSGKDRKITLPPVTAAFFAQQVKGKLPTAPLVARADGKFWNKDSWKGPFKDSALLAKLPSSATTYALRHSVITDLIALHKLSTMTVAQLAGTSVLMIEKHYGHLLHDHAANALALLAL